MGDLLRSGALQTARRLYLALDDSLPEDPADDAASFDLDYAKLARKLGVTEDEIEKALDEIETLESRKA